MIIPRHRTAFCILIASAMLAAGVPLRAYAQESVPMQETKQTEALATLAKTMNRSGEKNKGDFNDDNSKIWSALLQTCSPSNAAAKDMTDGCATQAVYAALGECEASGRYFRKGSKGWQVLNIVLTLASAASTAAGASGVSTAKVWSTLGGGTGLLSGQTSLNAYASGDQSGLGSVDSTITTLNTLVQGQTGANATKPDALTVFRLARGYGAACATAANGSPTTTPSSKPSGGKGGSS